MEGWERVGMNSSGNGNGNSLPIPNGYINNGGGLGDGPGMDSSKTCVRLLYETLRMAGSQNPAELKVAETKLAEWEAQPGYYAALLSILSNYEADSTARFMAVVTLKNGVEKYWRNYSVSGAKNLSDEERSEIKKGLEILVLNEPYLPLVVQLSVVIAKIARLEVPRDWPTLLPTLLAQIRVDDPSKQHRALIATYHVVKILSTKRLTGDRRVFYEMSFEVFDYLYSLWDTLFIAWASSGANGDSLERAHFALKILRILVIRGYKVPHESGSVLRFIPSVMQRAKETLEFRLSRQDSSALLEKHVITMWKIVDELLETHPLSFVPFLQGALEFAAFFGFSPEGQHLVFERVAIHALNLLKGIILCPEFRAPDSPHNSQDSDGMPTESNDRDLVLVERRKIHRDTSPEVNPLTLQAAKVKDGFFSEETLAVLVRILVTKYLPLTQAELSSWNDDPEEFAIRMVESGETWKYNLRQSAETLFVTLFKRFRKPAEVLLKIINEFQAPLKNPADHPTIIAKDALYNAVGIVAYDLFDEFCFDTWLNSTLVHEVALPVPILQRRIAWLVGIWTSVKISNESRSTVYALLLGGLGSSDIVVRLSCSQSIRYCLDDFDFDPEQFTPFLHNTFCQLFNLLKDVQESDNKMRVLHTMSFLIERTGPQLKSSAQFASLTQYIPLLWSTEHNMLKAAVVSTSIQLVNALESDSSALKDLLFPIIKIATDLKTPEHVYLLEDGLELWLALMEYSSDSSDDSYVGLVENLIPLLSISTEHLKTALSLVNSYTLLYPEVFVQKFGLMICSELASSITDLRSEGVALVLRCLEMFLRSSPINGPQALTPILKKIFENAITGLDTPILISLYLSLVARLLLVSEPLFQLGLNSVANLEGKTVPQALGLLTEIMASKSQYIVQNERKKLLSIALLKLLSTGHETVLHCICGIFLAVAETLNDIVRTDGNGKHIDKLCIRAFEPPREPGSLSTQNDIRKTTLASRDIVYTVDLVQLFRSEVSSLRTRLGEGRFNEALSTIDSETMAMAKPYLE